MELNFILCGGLMLTGTYKSGEVIFVIDKEGNGVILNSCNPITTTATNHLCLIAAKRNPHRRITTDILTPDQAKQLYPEYFL